MTRTANDAKLAHAHPLTAAELVALRPDQCEVERDSCWTRICRLDEIPQLGARVLCTSAGPAIAIFRTASDEVFALADRCPHRGGPLSQGIVYGDRVACPLHNTSVELGSGCAVAPDTGRVQRYGVKLQAGVVYVDLGTRGDADG